MTEMLHTGNHFSLVLGFCIFIISKSCICAHGHENGLSNSVITPPPRPPATVNVGALLAYNTTMGRVAKQAIEMAVEDVNNSPSLLNATQLLLTMMDSNCSAFIGTAAALELMKKNNVAIVGPQFSVLAHIVSSVANELHIPVLSFGATDPTLSSLQYPYFLRMAHSDLYEMTAVAAVIGNYDWKNIVAVYIDDDYGRNGISALSDVLGNVGAKIVYKAALPPGASKNEIGSVMVELAMLESRIFVVHMNPDAGLNLFSEALYLGMLSNDYVWIATDWLSSALDSTTLDYDAMNSLQGVISLRRHIPLSDQEHAFIVRWNNLNKAGSVDARLNAFGLYAYDAVWAIAHSIDTFLTEGGKVSFTDYPQISSASGSKTGLAKLKVFGGGPQLQNILLQTNFTGLTGPVNFNKNGDLLGSTFEIINIVGTGYRKLGYWTNQSGLSVIPPDIRGSSSHATHSGQKLYDVIWPGENKLVPRGWALPNNGKHLLIGVPRKVGFQEFVRIESNEMMDGFCIDVFVAAVNLLPYAFPYTFVPFGDGNLNPDYNVLVQQVASKKFDAAVGDITIVTDRSKIVDFTQPYIEAGLAVVAPLQTRSSSGAWAFLQPFTLQMWCTTGAFFLVIGAVVWILEHKTNPDFRGHPKKQALTVLWFSFSTLFNAQRENVGSNLGRVVLIVWLFVVLIISSSYTASLTSILTVQQLSPTVTGLDSLIASDTTIGYPGGSYIKNYLLQLNIAESRLVPLNGTENYAKHFNLPPSEGGVAAIVDTLPAVQFFLSTQCNFTIVGSEFTKGGWGFAFPKGSQLAIDFSTAILTLSETGELQRIHDKWLSQNNCGSQANQVDSTQLHLKSFWGLFLIIGVTSFASLVAFLGRAIWQFIQHFKEKDTGDASTSVSKSFPSNSARILRSFIDFIDEKENSKGRKSSTDNSETSQQRT